MSTLNKKQVEMLENFNQNVHKAMFMPITDMDERTYDCESGFVNCFMCIGREECTRYQIKIPELKIKKITLAIRSYNGFDEEVVTIEYNDSYRCEVDGIIVDGVKITIYSKFKVVENDIVIYYT